MTGAQPIGQPNEMNVIVIANWGTDDTADVAAAFGPKVRGLSVPVASKHRALVTGDGAATGFRRICINAGFLVGSTGWEILFPSSWFWQCGPDLVPRRLPGEQPGPVWIRELPAPDLARRSI